MKLSDSIEMKPIATIESGFSSKFGIPRQSGLVPALKATVVFHPPYRNPDAVRGLEEYSHIWLIWQFSKAVRTDWSPTVRPPRLGGNTRMGVFATRSPFRPNNIGLSCVQLEGVEHQSGRGPLLHIAGADLLDGTPILDIKPYLPYADSHADATGGFSDTVARKLLRVEIAPEWLAQVEEHDRAALIGLLEQDPRPSYHEDAQRVYGFEFSGMEIRFIVVDNVLMVTEIRKKQ